MNTIKHYCSHCGKSYTRKTSFTRHVILCELNSKSKHVLQCEKEEDELPTMRQLYTIIEELGLKCNKMEADLAIMKRQVETKTKKINIVEWLDKNSRTSETIIEWITQLEVTEKDVETLLEKNIIEAMRQVLINQLENVNEENKIHLPIFCSHTNANTIYIYDNLNKEKKDIGNQCWKKCSKEDLLSVLKHFHKKIVIGMGNWKRKHQKEIDKNEKMDDLLTQGMSKLMDVDFSVDSRFGSKMKNVMYNLLKSEMNLIEYEY